MLQIDGGRFRRAIAIRRVRRPIFSIVALCLCGLALPPAAARATCPNESLRTGFSAHLPDCRAYELVTPPDSNGRKFGPVGFYAGGDDVFATEPVIPGRESFVFSTRGTPLQSPSGATGLVDVYEAERAVSGWRVVRRVSPSGDEATLPYIGGLSSDHTYIFTHVGPVDKLVGTDFGGLFLNKKGGWDADYLGDSQGHFELTGIGSLGSEPCATGPDCGEPLAQGRYISPGGEHVIFSTGKQTSGSDWCAIAISKSRPCAVKKLEPNAPPSGTGTVYDRAADGPTHVVSLLPGDAIPTAGENAAYQGASADSSAIAFKIKGTLYVRVNDASTEKVAEAESTFGGISGDGRYLFYVTGGNIHRFDTDTKTDVEVNSSGDGQMVNASADGSHVYFISEQQLDGAKGAAGQPNMYVWSGGSLQYVATVLPGDLVLLARWTDVVSPSSGSGPGLDQSRTTPEGGVIVFASRAQLTPPYENASHTEIYRYDAGDETIACVSCNPEGTPASADARLQDPQVVQAQSVIHNLTQDGSRVFFETTEALGEGDVDGINDIYEWQQLGGGGDPEVGLISSGESVEYPEVFGIQDPNVLLGIKPDGSDVFFRSQDALVPGAGVSGVSAIYNARVDGGFPQPPPPTICVEEGCRPPLTPPPSLGAAASSTVQGTGNVLSTKKKRSRCHRRSHKHKRCTRKGAQRMDRGVSVEASSESAKAAAPVPVARASEAVAAGPRHLGAMLSLNGEFLEYGIKSVTAGESTTAAAHHPDVTTELVLNPEQTVNSAKTENVVVDLPPGIYGNPDLTPRCSTGDFIAEDCPVDSQVGIIRVTFIPQQPPFSLPLFNLALPHPEEEIARFGVAIFHLPTFIDVSLRTAGDYGITATVRDAQGVEPFEAAETIIWGNPADPSHDAERSIPGESDLPPIAFMTNPSACQSQEVGFSVTSYELPGEVFNESAPMAPITECQGLPFAPSFEAHPTSQVAGAPTGVKAHFELPQTSDPAVSGTATMHEARITLPEGMSISSSAADGLEACSDPRVHLHQEVNAQCPDASKLGTATISSPGLPHPLEAGLYQRSPEAGHLFRLWLVSDELGLHVKLPAEIHADPNTGQLTTVFADLPPVPVEAIDLDIWGGPRAPLKNPDACGTYQTAFTFTPHSDDPPVSGQTAMTIDQGCGARGFNPKLKGGATVPKAGAFSPFVLDLAREDGEEDFADFEVALPKGELAKLKGVPLCPDAQAQSGQCPEGSRIGTLVAAAGPGPAPLWIPQPGKEQPAVYLAGPYKEAPYSVVSVVPAQAGPFDLGDVVVRSALAIDPETAVVTVRTDPLPQFVEGVPVLYRRLHVLVDRPEFTLNPSNCSEEQITSTLTSTKGTLAHPTERFQVDGCKALGFKPRLALKLKGGTRRGDYPALRATLKARKGDANLKRVSVALPHSEFLAQEHIQTICTRKQFVADKCPKGSVYGKAKAWTPLLDKPLAGPVYLRSSDHPLPDLVIDLKGQIEAAVAGRLDSIHGGIRASFEAVPDAPISKFVLQMKGGNKGLLTNSTEICARNHRATVRMRAQNGRAARLRPVLGVQCGK
jgi:hypothetical protein